MVADVRSTTTRFLTQPRVNLDWVRGFAALLVAFLHGREVTWVGLRAFMESNDANPFDKVLAYLCVPVVWGAAGVAVFFVLSGYVIHASNAIRLNGDRAWRLDAWTFYTNRFIRIYSVLIAALVLTYVLDHFTFRVSPESARLYDRRTGTLIGNLLALQGSVVLPYGSNGPLWTLAIEIHFYALYPLLLIARRHFSAVVLLACSGIVSAVSCFVLRGTEIELFTSYYFCWMLGFMIAEYRATHRAWKAHGNSLVAAFVAAALGCAVYFGSVTIAILFWSVSAFFGLMVLLDRPPSDRRLPIRALTFTGVFSYSLYAAHKPVVLFLNAIFNDGAKSDSMSWCLTLLAATIVVCFAFYLLIERWSIEWLTLHRKRLA